MTTEGTQITAKKTWLSDLAKGKIHYVVEGAAGVAAGVVAGVAVAVAGVGVAAGVVAGAAGVVGAAGVADKTREYAYAMSKRVQKECRRMGAVLGLAIPMVVGGAVYGPAEAWVQNLEHERAAAAAARVAVPVPATSYTITGKGDALCLVEQFKGADGKTILVLDSGCAVGQDQLGMALGQ